MIDILDLLKQGNAEDCIRELQNGRIGALPNIDDINKELDTDGHKVMDPIQRKDKIVKVQDGSDANPYQEDNTKPGYKRVPIARIALALQKLIVERAVSFAFGNPIDLEADPKENTREQDVFNAVKDILKDVKIRSTDRKIGRSMFSTTEVAELWYTVPSKNNKYGFNSDFKLRVAILSPMYGDRLYPYFDEKGDLLAFSREYVIEDANTVEHRFFETYTAEYQYKWQMKDRLWQLEEGYPIKNAIGKIPVIYGQQEDVEWANVQNLIDRLETLLSNFADTNDYHASPKIFVTGRINGWAQKGESGAVIEGDEGSQAQYLSWQQAPEAVRLEIDTLLRMIYTLTQTPDISFDNIKGIGSVSGVALKLLFMDAHLKVQTKSEVFDEYLQRRMSVIQAFLKQMNARDTAFCQACDNLMIEPKLHPYMIDDESSIVATLMSATGQKQICSRENAIRRLGWADDVQKEMDSIIEEEQQSSLQMSDIFNQEPTE